MTDYKCEQHNWLAWSPCPHHPPDVSVLAAGLSVIANSDCRCGIAGPCGCGERMREQAQDALCSGGVHGPIERHTKTPDNIIPEFRCQWCYAERPAP